MLWRKYANTANGKRSVKIAGFSTSVALEDAFWLGIQEIALKRNLSIGQLIETIDKERQHANLSSVIRLFVLDHYIAAAKQKTNDRRAITRPRPC
ncbi:MAG: ribbon-helix-helix domain-containing protein [Xanthobacteraceae bacterium]